MEHARRERETERQRDRERERDREKAITRPKVVLVPLSPPSLETYLGTEWTLPPPLRPPTEYHQRALDPSNTKLKTERRNKHLGGLLLGGLLLSKLVLGWITSERVTSGQTTSDRTTSGRTTIVLCRSGEFPSC